MDAIIVLQARTNSQRLPAKVLLPVGGFPLVVLSASRLRNTGIPLLIAIPENKTDDYLFSVIRKNKFDCFRGNLDNTLKRFVNALSSFSDDTIVVRATADNVFPDGSYIGLLLKEFKERQLHYLAANGKECGLPYGLSAEICYLKDLREAEALTRDSFDQEHVTPFIIKKYGKVWSNQFGFDYGELRSTIDYLEDYLRVALLFDAIDNPVSIRFDDLCEKLKVLEYGNNSGI